LLRVRSTIIIICHALPQLNFRHAENFSAIVQEFLGKLCPNMKTLPSDIDNKSANALLGLKQVLTARYHCRLL
jgi:hypothetical protein